MPARAARELPARPSDRAREELQELGSDRAAAHGFDQLTRERHRLPRLQDIVVEREAAESGVNVLTEYLRSLRHVHSYCHGTAFWGHAIQEGFGVLVVFGEYQGETHRQQNLRRITVHRRAVLLENLLLPLQVLEVAAKPVADVAVLREQPKRPPLAASADQDLRTAWLHGARNIQRAVDPVVIAFE